MFKVMCLVATGWHVVISGSNANNATNDGAFYLNANNVLANVNQNYGAQLMFIQGNIMT
jgi:hypothetical protein